MKTLQELQPLIVEWAKQRNIHLPECAPKQRLKLIEECGELASAILKNDVEKQKDAIGDVFVVLVILAEQLKESFDLTFVDPEKDYITNCNVIETIISEIIDRALNTTYFETIIEWLNDASLFLELDLTECANIAWNEIKDRKGQTVDGTFIKN